MTNFFSFSKLFLNFDLHVLLTQRGIVLCLEYTFVPIKHHNAAFLSCGIFLMTKPFGYLSHNKNAKMVQTKKALN